MPVRSTGKNGRVLTAKHVDEETYQAIHNLPYGDRGRVMLALLNMIPHFAESYGRKWQMEIIEGRTHIVPYSENRVGALGAESDSEEAAADANTNAE